MRVLFCVDALFEDAPGGSRVVARELARGLVARGHTVTLLAARLNSEAPAEETEGRLRVVRLPRTRGPAGLVRAGYAAARRLWAKEKFDLLHTHFAYAAVGPLAALPRHVPHVRSFYGPWDSEAWVEETQGPLTAVGMAVARCRRTVRHAVEAANLRRSGAVIVLSEYSRKQTAIFGTSGERTRLVAGGTDTQRFVPAKDKAWVRHSLGLPVQRPLLLSVRRLTARMGLDVLLQAMPAVLVRHPDALLLIGGHGPEQARLERLINDLHLENHVTLLGFVPDERLATYYQAADVFVLPTVALEGFGLVTTESLACGTPVLGTPIGATPELLHRLDDRLLLPGTTPGDIAHGLNNFLDDFREQGAFRTLTPDCLHRFVRENYSWEAHVRGVEQVYQELLLCHMKGY